jgi:hypothetical protein
MNDTLTEPSMQAKPIVYGSGIIVKNLDDKILITVQNRTHLKDGNFTLDAEVIHIEAGPGIKISSKAKDTLVISCDLIKMEERIYDFEKRVELIERVFSRLMKDAKEAKK